MDVIGYALAQAIPPTRPVAGSITTEINYPPGPTGEHKAVTLPSGLVFTFGGTDSGGGRRINSYVYDHVTDTWTSKMSAPSNLGLIYYGLSVLPSGKVLSTGGWDGASNDEAGVQVYDPAANTWTTRANMPTTRRLHRTSPTATGAILHGGYTNAISPATYAYDEAADTWTLKADGPHPRHNHGQTTLSDGTIYIAGGNTGTVVDDSKHVHIYNPAANTWTQKSDMPSDRVYLNAGTLPDGRVIIVGGANVANNVFRRETLIHDLTTDTFTTADDIPLPSNAGVTGAALALLNDGSALNIAGYDDGTLTSTVVRLVPPYDERLPGLDTLLAYLAAK